jgi:hypothetical protein
LIRALRLWQVAVLAAAVLLGGCGEDSVDDQEGERSAQIRLESPGVQANGLVSPHVSCGSGTIWLPLKWGSVPSETEELILYFGRFKGGTVDGVREAEVSFAAMVTDISPDLHGMAANTFPARSEYRYFISIENCPLVRNGQHYLVELFALGHRYPVPQDDQFAIRLGEEALGVEEFATESEAASLFRDEALATGRFVATYAPL